MNSKLCVFLAVFLTIATQAEAAESSEATARKLAIAFLALCCAVLFITLIIVIVLVRARSSSGSSSLAGGHYEMSGISKRQKYSTTEAYGVYQDPTVSGSIYLPLDRDKMNREGESSYAHLESGTSNGTRGDTHDYETLKNGSTFKKTEAAYDNPEFVVTKDDGSDGSVHEYEVAGAKLSGDKPKPM